SPCPSGCSQDATSTNSGGPASRPGTTEDPHPQWVRALADAARGAASRSDRADAVRLRALRALRDLELDTLGVLERAVAVSLDRAVVDEHVGSVAPVLLDEAVALLSVEPLHGSLCHVLSFRDVGGRTLCPTASRRNTSSHFLARVPTGGRHPWGPWAPDRTSGKRRCNTSSMADITGRC